MTYPIILAHGVCRFDTLWKDALNLHNNDDPESDKLHYFKGIRTMLKKSGYSVYHSNVSWGAGVDKRAEDLKQNILSILSTNNAEKVNIIAHSMGGLDSRHMLFNDRNQGKIHKSVASLTTISTPHKGSPFADWGTNNLPHVIPLAQKLGLDLHALNDLRTDKCKAYNSIPEVSAFEEKISADIMFNTYAGRQDFMGIFNVLKPAFYIIEKQEGENDGLVSVSSARWQDQYFRGTIENTDHLNELGWWDPDQFLTGEDPGELLNRIHKFYAEVAHELP